MPSLQAYMQKIMSTIFDTLVKFSLDVVQLFLTEIFAVKFLILSFAENFLAVV